MAMSATSTGEAQMIRCTHCGAMNRVPTEKLRAGRAPICGRCKKPLELYDGPLVVTDANFLAQVEQSPVPVLLDMWAPWCGPCRILGPVVEELAGTFAGRIRVAKLNVDENPVTASRFQVQSIPTLLLLQNGREIDRMVGVQPKSEIVRRVERVITA
jgi:thioredoxin 2